MHTASWCFSMFLKWKCKVTFILHAQIAGLTHYTDASSLKLHAPLTVHRSLTLTVKFVQNQQCDGWVCGLCVTMPSTRSLSRVRLEFFACSTGFLWHSSNHVCPILICMPSFNPSLDAFVYTTTPQPPHLILLLILWLLVFNSDLNWLSPNQKSLFHPCEKVLAALTFYKLFVLCSWNGSAADLRGL